MFCSTHALVKKWYEVAIVFLMQLGRQCLSWLWQSKGFRMNCSKKDDLSSWLHEATVMNDRRPLHRTENNANKTPDAKRLVASEQMLICLRS